MSSKPRCSNAPTLQATVANIHNFSVEALEQIAAIARITEIAVGSRAKIDAESLRATMQVIWRDAESLRDLITAEAESVGCLPEDGQESGL
ncbi:hypothetical protein [Uliginosibacterium sediminicola]|uniref:Uncharacterized protein n=1 Tax=Uliginosibacterium sediminicola TaxID=2024550 RepID=A0ABU9YVT8_9RHOO